MMWQSLWNKIGKQPVQVTQNENVVAIFNRDELIKLLNDKKPTYMIPLALKHGTGKRRMWFIKAPNRSEYQREREYEHECSKPYVHRKKHSKEGEIE